GHVSAGNHQVVRKLLHLEAFRVALEPRHEVEARQRRPKAQSQEVAHVALEQLRAGEEPQPQTQRAMVVGPGARFAVGAACLGPVGRVDRGDAKQDALTLNRLSLKYFKACPPSLSRCTAAPRSGTAPAA